MTDQTNKTNGEVSLPKYYVNINDERVRRLIQSFPPIDELPPPPYDIYLHNELKKGYIKKGEKTIYFENGRIVKEEGGSKPKNHFRARLIKFIIFALGFILGYTLFGG